MSTQAQASNEDTIAALATPPGKGGIGVIRVSGKDARDMAVSIIGRTPRTRYAEYVEFRDASGETIDQGIAIFFESPASFTGEDVLELQGHGGPVVMDMLLNRVIQLGARQAKPGEFSERAFLNGKIDLSQAEAIADLIDSQSQKAARSALRSLKGKFSEQISRIQGSLISLRLYIEASMDFPEEEVDFLSEGDVDLRLSDIVGETSNLLQQSREGAILREGVRVVLAGRPNVGKSSLMNLLTRNDTAIVTDVPGTTRDIIREEVDIEGLRFQLVDTAGIRESSDSVEKEGVKRALDEIIESDIVLLLVDAAALTEKQPEMSGLDTTYIEAELRDLVKITGREDRTILVINKSDLLPDHASELKNCTPLDIPVVRISALTGEGVDRLVDILEKEAGLSNMPEGGFTARTRHIEALQQTSRYLQSASEELQSGRKGELVAEDLKMAHNSLSLITGEFTPDDLLGEIFSSFCIGK